MLGLLFACTSEEGAEKHIEKGKQQGSMLKESGKKAAEKSDMKQEQKAAQPQKKEKDKPAADKKVWKGEVFKKPGAPAESVGQFATRDECNKKALAHIKKKKYKSASHSCRR